MNEYRGWLRVLAWMAVVVVSVVVLGGEALSVDQRPEPEPVVDLRP